MKKLNKKISYSKAKILLILFIFICMVFSIFSAGVIWAKLELPPYHFLRDIKKNFTYKIESKSSIPNIISNEKEIETVHLPLIIKKYDLTNIIKNPKFGGICSVENIIIGISWNGEGYFINQNTGFIKRIDFRLPNSKELLNSKYPGVAKVYDIACKSDNNSSDIEVFITSDFIIDNQKSMRLSRIKLSIADDKILAIGDSELIYELDSGNVESALTHQGKIKVLNSGKLLISGSYRLPEIIETSGTDVTEAGKLILINPLTKESSIYSTGHRNVQGIEEADSGEIFSTEHGPKGGDEINIIINGYDYGWPLFTHGADYEHYGWREKENFGRHNYNEYEGPLFSWVPSIATSPLIQVKNFNSHWNGDLLIGTLKNRSLYRIRINNNAVRFVERIWIGNRIRDLANLKNQKIALLTDSKSILVLEVNNTKLEMNNRITVNVRTEMMQKCTSCHHFGETNENHASPSLTGLIGRKIASDNYEKYSNALLSLNNKVWTKELLKDFLIDPNKFAPGTSMPRIELVGTEIERLVEDISKL